MKLCRVLDVVKNQLHKNPFVHSLLFNRKLWHSLSSSLFSHSYRRIHTLNKCVQALLSTILLTHTFTMKRID